MTATLQEAKPAAVIRRVERCSSPSRAAGVVPGMQPDNYVLGVLDRQTKESLSEDFPATAGTFEAFQRPLGLSQEAAKALGVTKKAAVFYCPRAMATRRLDAVRRSSKCCRHLYAQLQPRCKSPLPYVALTRAVLERTASLIKCHLHAFLGQRRSRSWMSYGSCRHTQASQYVG